MTKYVTTTLALAAALGFSVAHADGQGAFVQADAGHASTHHAGTTWGVSGGYRWTAAQSLYVGLEGGYQDLGTSKFHSVLGRPPLRMSQARTPSLPIRMAAMAQRQRRSV